MNAREAKRLAYRLVATELRLTAGCGAIVDAPEYPTDPEDVRRVEEAIEAIILSLAARGD